MILDAINKSLPPTPGNLWPMRRDIFTEMDKEKSKKDTILKNLIKNQRDVDKSILRMPQR
jgi:hypothetical protein